MQAQQGDLFAPCCITHTAMGRQGVSVSFFRVGLFSLALAATNGIVPWAALLSERFRTNAADSIAADRRSSAFSIE